MADHDYEAMHPHDSSPLAHAVHWCVTCGHIYGSGPEDCHQPLGAHREKLRRAQQARAQRRMVANSSAPATSGPAGGGT